MTNGVYKIRWSKCFVCWLGATGLLAYNLFAASTAMANGDAPPYNNEIQLPAISIIIDDMGNLKGRDTRALRLPGALTYAFLPHTPHAEELANLAFSLHKEIMLHLPMESMDHANLGPGGLTLDMTYKQFLAQLESDIASVPHIVGVNNHMGSLLTQHPGYMSWLMKALVKHDNLYFVDSYTTKASIGQQIANENWIPNLRRDVFLDDDLDPEKIKFQFKRLLKLARENNIAVGIGHPHPETIAVLKKELPKLTQEGILLLPVSKLINRHMQRFETWRAFLYP